MHKFKKIKYPANWELISAQIRFIRAQNHCEECKLINGSIIKRLHHGKYRIISDQEIYELNSIIRHRNCSIIQACKLMGFTKIILTVAHLDHDVSNNDPTNLKALCQRCHLNYDRLNNKFRKSQKKISPSQQELPAIVIDTPRGIENNY